MQPTADEIRAQLDRMLASDSFANSDRLRRFLRYIVERTLAGEGGKLKEYVVGTEVFDRTEQYDPRVDSIVRVEAGRLRAKIDEYYNHTGQNDEVIIRIPRGSYAPTFEQRARLPVARPGARRRLQLAVGAAALLLIAVSMWDAGFRGASTTSDSGTTIAVLPFATYATDESVRLLAARVTDGVTSELAGVGTLLVVSHTSAIHFAGVRRPLPEIARALDADIVMEASFSKEGDQLHVDARLVDGQSDRKFWVKRFAGTVQTIDGLQRDIAAAVASAATGRRR